jgi:hypothetical protein
MRLGLLEPSEAATPASDSGEPGSALVVGAGLFLGVSAFALSVSGMLWRIDALAVGLCLAAALAVFGLWVRRSGLRLGMPIWALALLLPLLVLPAIAATAPPHEWDEVAYGAALPRDYAAAGRFFYNADYGPYSAFPSNYEALTTATIVLARDVIPARGLTVLMALGLAAIAAHLSRLLGVSWPGALLAATLVLSAEALVTSIPTGKNDVANAFFQSLALLAVAGYAARRDLGSLALGGFFLGTALGVKYSSLQFAFCIAPLTVGLVLAGPGRLYQRLRRVGIFAIVTLATALPWYVRNYVLFDNPFFPFLNELLSAHNGFTAQHSAITREMFSGWLGYSWSAGTPRDFLSNVAQGFGWVPVLLSVPGLIAAALRRRSAAAVFLGVALLSSALLTLFAGYWLPRYFLTLLVLACVFTALAVAEVLRVAERMLGRRAAVVALVLLVAAVGGGSLRWQWNTGRRLVRDVVHLKRQDFLRTRVRYWAVADWANCNLGPEERIGMGVNVQPFYYLQRPYFHIHPMTEKGNLQSLETPEQFLQAFRDLGLSWLALAQHTDTSIYAEATAPRMNAFLRRLYAARRALVRSGKLTPVASMQGVRIYRVEAPKSREAAP